jgi:hypothetical protein
VKALLHNPKVPAGVNTRGPQASASAKQKICNWGVKFHR